MSKYYLIVNGYDSGLNELLDGKTVRYDYKKKKSYFFNPVKDKNDKLCRNAILEANRVNGKVTIKLPIIIHYLFYVKDRGHDRSNTQSAFIKSFEDALQQTGMIRNDGYKDIVGSTTDFCVDKQNPRVLVCIEEVNSERVFWEGWLRDGKSEQHDYGTPSEERKHKPVGSTKPVRSNASSVKNKRPQKKGK